MSSTHVTILGLSNHTYKHITSMAENDMTFGTSMADTLGHHGFIFLLYYVKWQQDRYRNMP